jgi:hypothetical protein
MSVSKLRKLTQTSPYVGLVAHNKGESISMIYDPWQDKRVPLELLDSKDRNAQEQLFSKLGLKGCIKAPPQEAEKLLLESQQYYRERQPA